MIRPLVRNFMAFNGASLRGKSVSHMDKQDNQIIHARRRGVFLMKNGYVTGITLTIYGGSLLV